MVLQARADITDKDGKRLGLHNQVYTHHIGTFALSSGEDLIILVVTDQMRNTNMAPLRPGRSSSPSCKGGKGGMPGMGGFGMMSTPKGPSSGHSGHMKRSPQGLGGLGGILGSLKFSMFIAKGNEGDASIFAPLNTTSSMKSGYWIGKGDQVLGMAEAISYKTVPQDVYLTIDYEYLPIGGPRPKEYLDVSFGTIMVTDCGELNLRKSHGRVA